MSIQAYWMPAGVVLLAAATWAAPTHALSMKECSTKYEAAKAAGQLGGMNWNAFRKAQCGANAAPAAAAPPQQPAAAARAPRNTYAFGAGGNAVFPRAIAPKYASESVGKARMHTCLDQYRANKTSNGNGGLRWVQKGGGYYSECNKRLGGK